MGTKRNSSHMRLDNGCRLCNFRNKDCSGGPRGITTHLLGIEELNRIPTKRVRIVSTSNNDEKDESSSSSPSIQSPYHKCGMNMLLAKFRIMAEVCPDDAIQSTTFLDLLEAVKTCNSNYKPPDSVIIESKFLKNIREEAEKYYNEAIEASEVRGCSLVYSHYCSKKDLFAWTPNGMVHMKSCSSSKDVIGIISTAIKEIGTANVVQFIFDDLESGITDMLGREYPQICHTRCVASPIQRLLKEICHVDLKPSGAPSIGNLNKDDWVASVARAARLVNEGTYKFKIQVLTEAPYKIRKSTVCQVYEFISLLELEGEWPDWRGEFRMRLLDTLDVKIGKEFLSKMTIVASIIRPLFRALFLAYGDGSSMGQIYETIKKVEDAVEACEDKNIQYKVQNLLKRYRSSIIDSVHVAAAFLNPIYMMRASLVDTSELRLGIEFIYDKLLHVDEKKAFWNEVEKYCLMLCQNEAMTISEASNPRIWWGHNGKNLPILKKYAIRILSQPCGSLLGQRYQMYSENHDFGISVMLMERFKSPQKQMSKSIILDDLDLIDDRMARFFKSPRPENEILREFEPRITSLPSGWRRLIELVSHD